MSADGPWGERKQTYIDHIPDMPEAVLRIPLADKQHNAQSILRDYRTHGEALWSRFNAGRAAQLWWGAPATAGRVHVPLEELERCLREQGTARISRRCRRGA